MAKINRIQKKDGKITKKQVDIPVRQWSSVRIDPRLDIPLAMQASNENRTLTAHVNYILEQHIRNSPRHGEVFNELYPLDGSSKEN